MSRRGRPRKDGERYPCGKLKSPGPPAKIFDIRVWRTRRVMRLQPKGLKAVYVITAGERRSKIGKSIDPISRARDIQCGQALDVQIFWAVRLSHKDADRIEKAIHDELRSTPLHLRGEWYAFDGLTAVAHIKRKILEFKAYSEPDTLFGRDVLTNIA